MISTLEFFILLLCSFLLFGLIFFFFWQNLFSVPYVPSSGKKVREIVKQLGLKPHKFVDLGSGDGNVVFAISDIAEEAHGVEINPYFIFLSNLRKKLTSNRNTSFHRGSFHSHDISSYDLIYLYLLPKVVDKLQNKFISELHPGAVIISHSFKIPNMKVDQIIDNKYFIYKM